MKKFYIAGAVLLLVIGLAWLYVASSSARIAALSSFIGVVPAEKTLSPAEKALSSIGTEVLPNVYDDQQSTVYIRVDDPSDPSWKGERGDAAIADIIAKKAEWERQFPDKKVIAMSIVTGNAGAYGHPIVVGLLIHYE
ncbi:MAG: hypothetical protein Q8N16_00520 [bacterium]|nr:hypothetical protein [bacterium]